MIGIYKITSPSLKVYIGQSIDIDSRWYSHRSSKEKNKLQSSFLKHGFENHIFEILEECEISLLNERERYWQDFYNVLGPDGLNLRLTETSDRSGYFSEESKLKMSLSSKGQFCSDETRLKISNANKGKSPSIPTREKLSKSLKGRTFTVEHKKNLSLIQKSQESKNKMSESSKNKLHTQETKDKISNFNKGKVASEESKKNMSIAQKLSWVKRRENNLKNKDNGTTT